MTTSEQVCNEIGAKFFSKDFVYENLKYYNNRNNKVELCDALFEYASIYVPIQIKERSKSKGNKTEESWLNEIIYGDAFNQIKATVDAIRSNNIEVNDLYHQKVQLCQNNLILPMIVFDNPDIQNYKRVIIDGNLKINVFKLDDYESMMQAIIHPYDIIYYLQERINWIQDHNLPNIIIGDGVHSTIIAKIKTEGDFALFFKQYIYEGQIDKQKAALRHLGLICTFRDRLIKKVPNYKTILNILELIQPRIADEFMARFDYAWKCACEDKFDFTKTIQVQFNDKKTDIVFFAVGRKELTYKEYYQVLADAKQLKHQADAILIFAFIGEGENECHNDWIYMEKEYEPADDALKFYESIGMFDGTMDYETYEEMCKKFFNN